jgi:putative ABC transport system substrate-binding protein
MNRRSFIGMMAGGLVSTPLAAAAQQAERMYRIGSLNTSPIPVPGRFDPIWVAFIERLRELGYVEGKNLSIEYRSSNGPVGPLPELAAELVRLKVDVIVVPSTQPAMAARQVTTTIPIVMGAASDVIETGLVKSLARPGGNITGLTVSGRELSRKRVEFLREATPKVSHLVVLADSTNPVHDIFWRETVVAPQQLHLQVERVDARAPQEVEPAFVEIGRLHPDALIVFPEPMLYAQRGRINDLAMKSRLPAMYGLKGHVVDGGLISYAPRYADLYRRLAEYVDKILKGAKPSDLPIEEPAAFELIINLKTAKALGLTIPPSLLQRADQVIE